MASVSTKLTPSFRAQFIGLVIGTAMKKTAKEFVKRTVFFAHDPNEVTVIGDTVLLERVRKTMFKSERKNFVLKEIVKEAQRFKDPETGALFTAP
ncbi:hypothetical protein ROZALSC1DRAFT_29738 [Rozella allomycis CSF55]|uniref:Nucleic acid-binding protein n=1 Tax=Rozella allomycis (strain CSF55) TaxID=988480 RepID=A0A075AN87_ROZAC|nr:hypothetical protein O9G_000897 [Rozella allomycis CSF55]RKP18591.1 hypothetical protein ROZALSC1DRAFT_29738 [Rozella allomycis CSF55]|eukprot:EPZ31252.1 hypothetical protein O9G_000897 [Rozella allomycis CSF55]